MDFVSILFIGAFALSLIIILTVSIKSKHFFKSLFLTAFSGLGCLFAVHLLSQFTALTLPVNTFTLAVSALSGIPGVIALLFSAFTV